MRRTAASGRPDKPLVVTEKIKGAQRLVSVSPQARRIGISVGLTLADARARTPDLWVEEVEARADAGLLAAIADDCDRFSPMVMIDAPDGLLLDITGCEHLFGGEALLRKAFGARMKHAGLHVRAVIAGAADSARALARHGHIAIVPPGEDAIAVRSLPIAALNLENDQRIALSRAGLKTIGCLADRPTRAFAARFGEAMTLRLRRVLGSVEPPFTPRRIVPTLWAERRFAEPIGRAEDVEAVLADLGREATEKLVERREGGRVFEASFFRADGAVRRIAIETGRPMRDPAVMMRLFREKLGALADPVDPGFGFDVIRLSLITVEKLDAVQTGLDGHAVEAGEVADLADRLSVRFGADRVLRFLPEDTHDPERAQRAVPASFNPLTSAVWPDPEPEEPPLRPSQIFDPPQPIEAVAEVPDGPPRRFNWRRVTHYVAQAEGPERIAPEWWRRPPGEPTRDYYRIEDDEGRRFWLFRSGLYDSPETRPRWYVHGVFA
ncbi:MAG TPA: DNA polymerase Y family protein [Hyphomonadaceae bacterium]|nr:DNA polymerase Y family protein [Hyphomonadaceae bacterium]